MGRFYEVYDDEGNFVRTKEEHEAGDICEVPEGIEPSADLLLCDGREVNREDYPELFAAIGMQFGGDETKGTFRMPIVPPRDSLADYYALPLERREELASMYGEPTRETLPIVHRYILTRSFTR